MDNEILIYDCEENDNQIKLLREDDGSCNEIWIGCEYAPSNGYSVIGIKDLDNALSKVGYFIGKVGGF